LTGPKLDVYDEYTLIIFQIMTIKKQSEDEQQYNEREQVSMLIFKNTVITLQEGIEGDCWDNLRDTIEKNERSKIRTNNSKCFNLKRPR
jgi:Mg2+ and Co2+ transporter CorA